MRKISLGFMILFTFLFSFFVFAEETPAGEGVSVGMEKVEIGGGNYRIVPRGSKVEKRGNLILVESTAEYTGRRFYEFEQRVKSLEQAREEFRKEMENLKNLIKELREKIEEEVAQIKKMLDELGAQLSAESS